MAGEQVPAEEGASEWDPVEPQTLIQGLKCAVCWEFFSRPHTIPCGHTFCTRCLQTLARLTRASRNRPIDRLRFRCPSCRKNTLARPILRRKASVNYSIKELIDEWFASPYASGTVNYITLRSVASQTNNLNSKAVHKGISKPVLQRKEINVDERPDEDGDNISKEEFRNILFHRIEAKSTTDKPTQKEALDLTTTSNEDLNPDDNVVSSSSESESEPEIRMLFGSLPVLNDNDRNRRRGVTHYDVTTVSGVLYLFCEQVRQVFCAIRHSRSRTFLTIFWFVYGGLIVCISRSFLPWMTFYTIIYFVILYAELNPQVGNA